MSRHYLKWRFNMALRGVRKAWCVWHTGLSPPALMHWTLAWYEHPGLRPSQTHSIAEPLYTWFQEDPKNTHTINEITIIMPGSTPGNLSGTYHITLQTAPPHTSSHLSRHCLWEALRGNHKKTSVLATSASSWYWGTFCISVRFNILISSV